MGADGPVRLPVTMDGATLAIVAVVVFVSVLPLVSRTVTVTANVPSS